MSSANPASSSLAPSVGFQFFRAVALLGLALGLTLVVDLLLLSFFPNSGSLAEQMLSGHLPAVEAGLPVAFALIVLTPLVLGFAARRLPMRTTSGLVYFAVVVATVLVINLIVGAVFSSVLEGFESLADAFFWRTHGAALALGAFTLIALGLVTWRLRPKSPRGFVWLGLAMAAVFVADLAWIAMSPALIDEINRQPRPLAEVFGESPGVFLLVLMLAGVVPMLLLAALWRLQRRTWWWIGGGWLALVPVLAYLAADDAVIRRPVTMEEIAPAFPGAEASYEVLMRYGRDHSPVKNFHAPQRIFEKIGPGQMDAGKPAEWEIWLRAHRDEVAADWADLAPVRQWWADLNAFERIGDLTPARWDAEIVAFAPLRSMTQHACAVASLLALDGHGDEAINALLPTLQIARKLQPSARILVRLMIAVVIERMSLQTASFILDHAEVSPAARARLAAALAVPGGGAAGARRLIVVEYAFILAATLDRPLGDLLEQNPLWLRRSLNVVGPFLYNPRATFNTYGDSIADAQELLGNRQLDRIEPQAEKFVHGAARPRFKNFMGSAMNRARLGAFYTKLAESYWKNQDLRAELLTRVTKS